MIRESFSYNHKKWKVEIDHQHHCVACCTQRFIRGIEVHISSASNLQHICSKDVGSIVNIYHRSQFQYGSTNFPVVGLGEMSFNSLRHICVGNLTIIGSDNGLLPGRRKNNIWTDAQILLIDWTLRNKIQRQYYSKFIHFHPKNVLENIDRKVAVIWSLAQCIKTKVAVIYHSALLTIWPWNLHWLYS